MILVFLARTRLDSPRGWLAGWAGRGFLRGGVTGHRDDGRPARPDPQASRGCGHGWRSSPFKGSPYGSRHENQDTLPWRYRVRKFEVDRKLIEGGYDTHEEELERKEDAIVDSEVALIEFPRRASRRYSLRPWLSD